MGEEDDDVGCAVDADDIELKEDDLDDDDDDTVDEFVTEDDNRFDIMRR